MSNALTAPHFQSHERPGMAGKAPLAGRAGLLALRHDQPRLQDQKARLVSLRREGMPQGFHGHDRHRHGAQPYRAEQVADGLLPAQRQQEGHERPSAAPRSKLDYKSAWFMCHRIREAMRAGGLGPLGGEGKIVEADETYYGKSKSRASRPNAQGPSLYSKRANGPPEQAPDRRAGRARRQCSHVPCSCCRSGVRSRRSSARISPAKVAAAYRRKPPLYQCGRIHFAAHETVKHTRGRICPRRRVIPIQRKATSRSSNAACAAFISTAKRNILHRYLAEFDHRYNYRVALGYSDIDRTLAAIRGVEGKRLMYRQPH